LETPWVEEMISKYHKTATENGAIVRNPSWNPATDRLLTLFRKIIPTIALCPSDVVSFLVAKTIHDRHGAIGAGEVNSTAKLEYTFFNPHSTFLVANKILVFRE
jgi:hypothetical protein